MTDASVIDPPAVASLDVARRTALLPGRARVVLLQTQAEAAGAQEISRILGEGLAARGYDVHHVFFFRRTAAYDDQPNTFFCASGRPGSVAGVVRMFLALARHLKALRPDVAVCFQHYGNIVGAPAARLAGIAPIIANHNTPRSTILWWARWMDLLFGWIGLFRGIVVNSHAVEQDYDGYPSGYRSRVVRIDHGFATKTSDLSCAEARRLLGLPANATLLGSVARLHPSKNLAAAIRLLLLEPDWRLALVGQGAERERLASLAVSLGVADRVHFVGELSPDRIAVFLRALDVFVFPSLAETFGLAVVEAAQAGIPVVANDLAVLREVLAVGGEPCAVFANANDTGEFAAAVRSLLADQRLRATLTARGRQLSQRYSLDAMIDGYAALIEKVIPR
jgi:L-malate glycosyltransferase